MNFVLIGAAGYIAPRHVEAIKQVGGDLIAVLDPHDSVGYLDQYFMGCRYFREFERFDRFCSGREIDYVVICSPNYLHDAHIRFGLRIGANVICEKPAVLTSRNLKELIQFEKEMARGKVNIILQLRNHPSIEHIKNSVFEHYNNVEIKYYTPRGAWYDYSWKGDSLKSGGVLFNIGIHLFDLAIYLFGDPVDPESWGLRFLGYNNELIEGWFKTVDALISFELSTSPEFEPFRCFKVDGIEYDLAGFNKLHTISYKEILAGRGWRLTDCVESIKLIEKLKGGK